LIKSTTLVAIKQITNIISTRDSKRGEFMTYETIRQHADDVWTHAT
jgi:hypothetical protein